MKSWKVSGTVLISLMLLLPLPRAYACGYVDFTRPYYNLFDPNLMLTDEFSPLFYTAPLYSDNWIYGEYSQKQNIAEWVKYLDNKVDFNALSEMIYDTRNQDLETASHGTYAGGNKALHYLMANGRGEILNYIVFAKKCEKYCNISYYWDEKPEDGGQEALIEEGKKGMLNNSSPFLKLRYAFQTVKLLHLYNRFKECITLFDDFIAPLKSESIIKYWALDHKAGALMKLKRRAQGLYLFSRVFKECPSRRYTSLYSFRVESQEEWEECLNYCKSNEEKATLYFLRAMNPSSVALEEMVQIHSLDPDSTYLPLLTVREINKLENELLTDELERNYIYIRNKGGEYDNKQLLSYLADLKKFVAGVLKQNKAKDRVFWLISSAYLDFLSFDPEAAKDKLKGISPKNTGYLKQLRIINVALAIVNLHKIDLAAENQVMALLLEACPEGIGDQDIARYVLDFFYFFLDEKELAKKYGCHHYFYDLRYNPDLSLINDLLGIVNKNEYTLFEKYLILRFNAYFSGNYIISPALVRRGQGFRGLSFVLLDMKATLLLLADKIDEAYVIYSALPEDFWAEDKALDPFTSAITGGNEKLITRLEFAHKLLELKKKIKQDPQDALSYYMLGNAYYNITYFSKSANLVSYFNSDAYYTGFTDCTKALSYYKKALELAKNRELKAECCFMLANCRQNMFTLEYNAHDYGYSYGYGYQKRKEYIFEDRFKENEKQKVLKGYREYFKLLKDEYADTNFYQEVIKECEYFSFYVNNF
jgi:hypothetical protein